MRARDVHILFADASTGSRSPALVHQGRIGEIIQAKPEQRRRVLEEAAGISGLHARRHEAELRLRAAEHNLARLEDVINQLATQADALKRQARQAIRYRSVAQQIRKAEATLFHLRWVAANAELAEAEHARTAATLLVAERTGEQAQASRRQALAAADLPALRDAEAAAAAALQRLASARDALDREEARARERIAELDRRLVQLRDDIARERRLASDAETTLARLAAEEKSLRDESNSRDEQRASVAQRAGEAEATLAHSEKSADALTGKLAELTAQRHALENSIREQSERVAKLDHEAQAIAAERGQLAQAGQTDIAMLASASEAAEAALAQAEAAALRAEAAHSSARQELEMARGPLFEAERRAQRLETEAKTLARLLHVDSKNLWPAAIDDLTVEKGYEAALGAALGDDLEAPIDASAPMRWGGATVDPADPALPQGAQALADHVKAPKALERRLLQIGLVTREDAARLAALLKPGQRLVSRDGDLWRWDGFSVAANAPTGAARRLAGKNRLADIESELEGARREVEARGQVVHVAEQEIVATAEAESAARHAWRTRQHEAQACRDRYVEAERAASRNAARLSALAEAAARLAASRDEAVARDADAQRALAGLSPAAELEGELAKLRIVIEGQRARLAEVRAEGQALTREADIAARRLAAIEADRSGCAERHAGATAQIAVLEARAGEAESEQTSLKDAPEIFAQKRSALLSEIEKAEAERRKAADCLAEGENALAEADRECRARLEAMSEAREQAARAEERAEAGKRRLADVAHEIHEMLEVEPAEVAQLAGIEAGAALPDAAEVEASLERLRRDRERLGAVNLRAEEELREVEAQHGSLVRERDDLAEAIKRLRQGITNLNREARERLLASFEQVSAHFQHLFTELFGGGTAELQLTESEDPLEAGLEIVAKPPGKKPATLSLLSGGEQALTALALIFAVFLTNPAPICVLDEVDAPLDDHNIERFCDLLDEMTGSTETRFVIITHNPITMARMNRLYGVTMAEHGISQLVSVDLEGAVKLREAS